MEKPKDLDKISGLVVQGTPVKPEPPLKFYVRRKPPKLLNKLQNMDDSASSGSSDFNTNNTTKEESVKKSEEPETFKGKYLIQTDVIIYSTTLLFNLLVQVDIQSLDGTHGKKNSKEETEEKNAKSTVLQDDSQHVNGERKKKYSEKISKKRFHRPMIMEDGKKPRNPTNLQMRTISNKRSKKQKCDEDEYVVELQTPEKQSSPKRRKNKAKKNVARTLPFDEEGISGCLELSRSVWPSFPKGKRRMTTLRRIDFHVLISPISFPMPIWKKQSKRSSRKKNMTRWTMIALSYECIEETLSLVEIHPDDIDIKNMAPKLSLMHSNQKITDGSNEHLKKAKKIRRQDASVQTKDLHTEEKKVMNNLTLQLNYQREHNLPSLADVPLHKEDILMKSVTNIRPEQSIKKATKGVAKLIKEMEKLNINRRVTTLGKAKKKLVIAKVNLDPETIKEWELLMENDLPHRSYSNEENTESKWKGEREIFQSRIELFINRMHLLQGNRKFKQWKGSVVDSVVGVFLTQNVSDYLSSNAFMSVAAKFPVDAKESLESLAYFIEEPQEVNNLVGDGQRPIQNGNDDAKNSLGSVSLQENLEHEKDAKRKNKKTGIMEDESVDWESLRKIYTKEGFRDTIHMDTVDWNAVRLSDQQVLADTIMKRGQHNGLARKILKFLNDEAKQNGIVDLEWLRDAPSDLVKRYLLEIEGIGLKSAECVRLLGLKHSAFPVDTNVGRIAVRLGWVPLEPLPDGVQLHQLFQYPSMDSIQKYLWPRLCKLPQETLYELHYQMITFGKVFCTKVIPNCNACPMKSECKYFASAYVSSKVLLEGPEEKTQEFQESQESQEFQESQESQTSYCHDNDAKMTSKINSIEECVSTECSNQTNCCEPIVEFPSSPAREIPELPDIEDTPCRSSCRSNAAIPGINIDIDALKKNVVDVFKKIGTILNGSDDEISKALAVMTQENACIPMKLPRKTKYYDRLRTEHVVYVLPDNHEILNDFERRECDDPSPYLLALWQPGETSNSFMPPKKKCDSDGTNLCVIKTCSYCWNIREESSNTYRGTILIPCRTAMQGGFPLNGTYFQTNEVFADHETSLEPIVFSRELCNGLEKRALYCGSSVTSIFRMLDETRTRLCFWTGFVCMRGFDRKQRTPEGLVRRLHTPPDERGEKHMRD
ncbi:DEMETER-like protein 3 isoform X1 [Brassica napus]|uniref:HhH-GPD domain-containing protein n=2 Tax=Brassica TaxID=3705 RepID=A0A0D3A241_BRAOL|nr:PREDICTED: DEMETER-like protein 3 isoform X1 [Brassica oleracea var. oleracea]XP_013735221.2 DEMETER-like protein 3 isoform X1 [Brassica napus]